MPLYRLIIDLDQLCFAAGCPSRELAFYLDKETGEIVQVRSEDGHCAEALLLTAKDGDWWSGSFKEWLDQYADDEQDRNAIRTAVMVERQFGTRYARIPAPERPQCYEDMLAFVAIVEDPLLVDWLREAIRGRGAFGRFRALLNEYSYERDHWFAFRQARIRERIMAWLASEGIEPVTCLCDEPRAQCRAE